jgi:hypothetical protein
VTDHDLSTYEIIWLPIKNLSVVWRKSQRPFNEKWAKQIADEFDPDLFEPVIVTKPNGAGVYHMIEGQHRKAGAEIALGPTQSIPCRVIGDADPARAARIWRGINKGRKAVRPISDFLVAVEGKEELECAILGIVKKAGYRVIDGGKSDNAISAVGVLRKIYQAYGEIILYHTLSTCRALWGSDPKGVAGPIMGGMAMFINEFHREFEVTHLRKVIQQQYKSPYKFIEAAQFERDRSSEPMDIAMSELIRMKYNRGRPEGKRLKRKPEK